MRLPANFKPELIPKFSVIRCPLELDGKEEDKLLVVIGHREGSLICFKATSKLDRYSDPTNASAALFYSANELSFFPLATAVQTDNPFVILHTKAIDYEMVGKFQVLGKMPDDFSAKLEKAVQTSDLLSTIRKNKILAFLRS